MIFHRWRKNKKRKQTSNLPYPYFSPLSSSLPVVSEKPKPAAECEICGTDIFDVISKCELCGKIICNSCQFIICNLSTFSFGSATMSCSPNSLTQSSSDRIILICSSCTDLLKLSLRVSAVKGDLDETK